jgi:hypothetical protein
MLEMAWRHENAWLGIHGQIVRWLDVMIRRTGAERLPARALSRPFGAAAHSSAEDPSERLPARAPRTLRSAGLHIGPSGARSPEIS